MGKRRKKGRGKKRKPRPFGVSSRKQRINNINIRLKAGLL